MCYKTQDLIYTSVPAGFLRHYSIRVEEWDASCLSGEGRSPVPLSLSWYLSWRDCLWCWEGRRVLALPVVLNATPGRWPITAGSWENFSLFTSHSLTLPHLREMKHYLTTMFGGIQALRLVSMDIAELWGKTKLPAVGTEVPAPCVAFSDPIMAGCRDACYSHTKMEV